MGAWTPARPVRKRAGAPSPRELVQPPPAPATPEGLQKIGSRYSPSSGSPRSTRDPGSWPPAGRWAAPRSTAARTWSRGRRPPGRRARETAEREAGAVGLRQAASPDRRPPRTGIGHPSSRAVKVPQLRPAGWSMDRPEARWTKEGVRVAPARPRPPRRVRPPSVAPIRRSRRRESAADCVQSRAHRPTPSRSPRPCRHPVSTSSDKASPTRRASPEGRTPGRPRVSRRAHRLRMPTRKACLRRRRSCSRPNRGPELRPRSIPPAEVPGCSGTRTRHACQGLRGKRMAPAGSDAVRGQGEIGRRTRPRQRHSPPRRPRSTDLPTDGRRPSGDASPETPHALPAGLLAD